MLHAEEGSIQTSESPESHLVPRFAQKRGSYPGQICAPYTTNRRCFGSDGVRASGGAYDPIYSCTLYNTLYVEM